MERTAIGKATLELVAAPESVRRYLLVYPDLATMLRDVPLLSDDERFDAVQGAIAPAPSGGGIAFRLDAAKSFTRDPPDDNVLLAGMSDDPAQRQPTTIAYFEFLNRFDPSGPRSAAGRSAFSALSHPRVEVHRCLREPGDPARALFGPRGRK